jgi:heme A synthase
MAAVIYSLCAITSALCAGLLIRAYIRTRARLLLWSSICFAGLTLNNVALWVDKLVLPTIDLSPVRTAIALFATVILLYGLIWEAQ